MDSLFWAGVFNLFGITFLASAFFHFGLAKIRAKNRILYLKAMVRSGYCLIAAGMFFVLNLIIHRDIPYIILYIVGLAWIFSSIYEKQKELKKSLENL